MPDGVQMAGFVFGDFSAFETATSLLGGKPVDLFLSGGEPEDDVSMLLLLLGFASVRLLETLTANRQEMDEEFL